jgi:hypothetical protein
MRGKPNLTDKEQSERFIETARELGVDESGERFERVIETIISGPPAFRFFPYFQKNRNNQHIDPPNAKICLYLMLATSLYPQRMRA